VRGGLLNGDQQDWSARWPTHERTRIRKIACKSAFGAVQKRSTSLAVMGRESAGGVRRAEVAMTRAALGRARLCVGMSSRRTRPMAASDTVRPPSAAPALETGAPSQRRVDKARHRKHQVATLSWSLPSKGCDMKTSDKQHQTNSPPKAVRGTRGAHVEMGSTTPPQHTARGRSSKASP